MRCACKHRCAQNREKIKYFSFVFLEVESFFFLLFIVFLSHCDALYSELLLSVQVRIHFTQLALLYCSCFFPSTYLKLSLLALWFNIVILICNMLLSGLTRHPFSETLGLGLHSQNAKLWFIWETYKYNTKWFTICDSNNSVFSFLFLY